MYYLGDDYNAIFNICYKGLQENPDNELLKNVMTTLGEHDKKYGIEYRASGFTIGGYVDKNDVKAVLHNDYVLPRKTADKLLDTKVDMEKLKKIIDDAIEKKNSEE